MKAYKKITKKELYKMVINLNIADCKRDLELNSFTDVTMLNAWKQGFVPAIDKLVENYGEKTAYSEMKSYEEKIQNTRNRLEELELLLVNS